MDITALLASAAASKTAGSGSLARSTAASGSDFATTLRQASAGGNGTTLKGLALLAKAAQNKAEKQDAEQALPTPLTVGDLLTASAQHTTTSTGKTSDDDASNSTGDDDKKASSTPTTSGDLAAIAAAVNALDSATPTTTGGDIARNSDIKVQNGDSNHAQTTTAPLAQATAASTLAENVAATAGAGTGNQPVADKTTTGKATTSATNGLSRHQLQQSFVQSAGQAPLQAGNGAAATNVATVIVEATAGTAQPDPTASAATSQTGHQGSDAGFTLLAGQGLAGQTTPAAATTTATATATVATLPAAVGSAPWQQQLGEQLLRFTQRGDHQIQLHLHPRELGPLQISLHLSDNSAQAQFFSAHGQVRDAVQQAIPQLREALAGQGIALGQALVGQQQQQQQQAFSGGQQPSAWPLSGPAEHDDIQPATAVRSARPASTDGNVDVYA